MLISKPHEHPTAPPPTPTTTAEYLNYMFKYDTVHGRYKGTVEHDDQHLIVDGKKIRAFQEMAADKIKWCVVFAHACP